MNIERVNQNLAAGAYGAKRAKGSGAARGAGPPADAAEAAAGAPPSAGDGVELSDQARFVGRATQAARKAPDVREGLVADLRQKVQDGSYVVDDEAVAKGRVDK